MSRTVDTSDLSALSDEDLEYLRDRGLLTPEQETEFLGEAEPQNTEPAPLGENVGDENTLGAVFTEVEGNGATLSPDAYADASNDRLKEELRRRGLSTSGNKQELIDRLEDDDAGAE